MSGRWTSSNRRAELPRDWEQRRQAVKRRASGKCEAEQHVSNCDGIGRECDHHADPHDHTLDNLRWLSTPCHAAKTQREAQAAKPKRTRPPEQHPGRLT
ncbi:hypothetical protein NOK12_16640 [Nocardioides sp. OK12]|nr:hypothetical protein NOK12_16640 [Nocardioides sp. OK12]